MIARRPLRHDLSGSLQPHRRSPTRHPLLPPHIRLHRTHPHDPHLPRHLPLEPQNRHRRRHWALSLLRLLKHSTRPRIQILGRVPGTNEFENAELYARQDENDGGVQGVEMVPNCLIVKIPEPLTFANTGSLKDRLRRLEDHGSSGAHPALPKSRKPEHNNNVIFDVHGVTKLDPAASQVLLEIVESYVERGVRVFFARVPSRKTEVWRLMKVSGIVDLCGGETHFLRSVDEALSATERQLSIASAEGVFSPPETDNVGSTSMPTSRRHTWAAIWPPSAPLEGSGEYGS